MEKTRKDRTMPPYFSKNPMTDQRVRQNRTSHPLEDPLNHEDQRDFLIIFERWRVAKRAVSRLFAR